MAMQVALGKGLSGVEPGRKVIFSFLRQWICEWSYDLVIFGSLYLLS